MAFCAFSGREWTFLGRAYGTAYRVILLPLCPTDGRVQFGVQPHMPYSDADMPIAPVEVIL
jgi:hypothetical protein